MAGLGAQAQPRALEFPVKAAFLARFASFVTWPDGELDGPLRLCVVGDDPFGPVLDQAANAQSRGGRTVTVVRLDAPDDEARCDVAYVAGSRRASVGDMLAAMKGAHVLTITDAARGADRGMIHFVVFQDRVRFQVDAAQAARSGLAFSSKLLALALSVKR
jgi:hypothetical protein